MNSIRHMGEEPIGWLLLRYSVPAILGFLAGALYQLVDRVMVGRGVGTDAVAAVTAAYPLSVLALALGLLVGTGTGIRISVLLGRNDTNEAQRYLGQGLRIALFNGTVLSLLTCFFTKQLLLACGCAPDLLAMAMPYARIISIGQIFFIAMLSMGNILRVQGHPMLSFGIMLASNLVNGILAALAIYVLHWGVTGTALATAIAQTLGTVSILLFVQSKRSILHILSANLKRDKLLCRSILSLGAPFGLMQILATLVSLSANHGAGRVGGPRAMAALGILNTVALLLMYLPFGVMQAMQPLLGYNNGSGHVERVRGILVRVLMTTVAMGLTFTCLVAIFPHPLAALFSSSDLQLIEMVAAGLPWFVLPLILFGVSGTLAPYFLSVHKPKKAAILLLGRQLLAIPLFLLLPHWRGFSGVYLVGPGADIPFALVSGWLLIKELRHLNRQCQSRHNQSAFAER